MKTAPSAPLGAAPGTGRALICLATPARPRFAGFRLSHGIVAAAVAVVMGIGFVAGTAFVAGPAKPAVVAAVAPPPETQMDVLYRLQGEMRSLRASLDGMRANAEARNQNDAIRGLKRSVDLIKQDLESVKTVSSGAIGQLSAKMDRLDRDPGPKLAEIAARLDKLDRDPGPKLAEIATRLDKLDRDPGQKLGEIASRMERLERQVASAAPTGSIPPQAPLPPPKPTPLPLAVTPPPAAPAHPEPSKSATIDGWMLRDVYNGMALVEGRTGGLREVAPGEWVPGVGEIRSIERRGRSWVVVTSRGIIQADSRW